MYVKLKKFKFLLCSELLIINNDICILLFITVRIKNYILNTKMWNPYIGDLLLPPPPKTLHPPKPLGTPPLLNSHRRKPPQPWQLGSRQSRTRHLYGRKYLVRPHLPPRQPKPRINRVQSSHHQHRWLNSLGVGFQPGVGHYRCGVRW